MTSGERLNRYLSRCGLASRRRADGLIADGKVSINGRVVRELGVTIDPGKDRVKVNGKEILPPAAGSYYALNKPAGYLCSSGDPFGRPTIYHLLPPGLRNLKYVGRLDFNTEGLLLLTDDGGLIERLTHPRHGLIRAYLAEIAGILTDKDLLPLRRGVTYEGETYRPAVARILRAGLGGTIVRVEIVEGRKREVRMMFRAIGRRVSGLRRISFGPIGLGGLPPGAHRQLTPREVALLKAKRPA